MKPKEILPNHVVDCTRFYHFLIRVNNFTTDLLNSFYGKEAEYDYQDVLYNIFMRFHLNNVAIKDTWGNFTNNSKFKMPILILLRTLISDYITMIYLIEGLKFEKESKKPFEEDFKKRFNDISNAFFIKVGKELDQLIAENKITPGQRKEYLQREKEAYPEHFVIGKKIQIKRLESVEPGKIIKELKSGESKDSAGIYQYYFYFSQYEHFTIKTIDFLDNDREEFSSIIGSYEYLLKGLLQNINLMNVERKFIKSLIEIIDSFEESFIEKKENK